MSDLCAIAAAYGLDVEVRDLGDWGAATLISEYDSRARVIRINARAVEVFRAACGEPAAADLRAFIEFAVAHELYHHREATGVVPRFRNWRRREAAADAFARARVAVSPRLAAFLAARTAE